MQMQLHFGQVLKLAAGIFMYPGLLLLPGQVGQEILWWWLFQAGIAPLALGPQGFVRFFRDRRAAAQVVAPIG